METGRSRQFAPGTTGVAQTRWIRVPVPNPPPQHIMVRKEVAELSLEQWRRLQVSFIAISESSYGRYSRASLRPKNEDDTAYPKAKAFYEKLLGSAEPLFDRERSTVLPLHPGIRVYRMPELP